MKNKIKLVIGVAAIALATFSLKAQNSVTIGTPFQFGGQTFLISTNESGGLTVSGVGTQGTNIVNVPTSEAQAMEVATAWLAANNPANANYYSSNEIVAHVGAVYIQNSGQAAVSLDIQKYGLWSAQPEIGLGADILEGNNAGKSGTAGAYAYASYRKVIGDVSGDIGLGGGYDNWNNSPMGIIKVDVEYRQNAHLGEYVGAGYGIEKSGSSGGGIIGGGIVYAF
jgi:hypothetical protein